MAKKKLGLEDLGGFVFSTNDGFDPDQYKEADQDETEAIHGRAGCLCAAPLRVVIVSQCRRPTSSDTENRCRVIFARLNIDSCQRGVKLSRVPAPLSSRLRDIR